MKILKFSIIIFLKINIVFIVVDVDIILIKNQWKVRSIWRITKDIIVCLFIWKVRLLNNIDN